MVGHDVEALCKGLHDASTVKDKPTCIIAKTFKGKGFTGKSHEPFPTYINNVSRRLLKHLHKILKISLNLIALSLNRVENIVTKGENAHIVFNSHLLQMHQNVWERIILKIQVETLYTFTGTSVDVTVPKRVNNSKT